MPGAWETLYVRVRGDSDLQKTFAKDEKAAGKLDKTLGGIFKKYSDRKVSLQVEEDGAAKTAAALKGVDKVADSVDGRSVDIKVDKDGSALKGVEGLSSGFKGLAGNIRATGTVLTAASIPFAIAGIGAGTPTILALGSSFAGLALNLGKAAAGFGLVAGAAYGGALVGLKAYTALISSSVSASKEAFEATHEHAVALAEQRRQTTLNTEASKAFNYELLDMQQGFAELQAAVGNKVFPLFTREMDYWGEILDSNRQKIADTAGGVARIAAGFSEWFRTADEGAVLRDTIDFINSSTLKGGRVLDSLGRAGIMAFQPLIPLASNFQDEIVGIANQTEKWVDSAEGQRRLGDIYRSLWEDAKRLGPVLLDTGRGLFNIFSAIDRSGLSDQATRGLESIASSFEHVTSEGTESRRRIDSFLNSALELMPHVAGAATALWKQIFRVADAAIDARQEGHKLTILQEIFDGIRDSAKPLGNLLVGTFKDLGPEIARLIPNLAQLAENFAGSSGPLTTFVRTLNRMLEIFNKLPDPVKTAVANLVALKVILGGMGVGAVVGPLGNLASNMWAVNRVTGALNGRTGLSAVAGSLSRIGLVLAGGIGLAAIAGAFYLAYQNSKQFHNKVNALASDLASWGKDKFADAKAAVKDIFDIPTGVVKKAGTKAGDATASAYAQALEDRANGFEGNRSAPYEFGQKAGQAARRGFSFSFQGGKDAKEVVPDSWWEKAIAPPTVREGSPAWAARQAVQGFASEFTSSQSRKKIASAMKNPIMAGAKLIPPALMNVWENITGQADSQFGKTGKKIGDNLKEASQDGKSSQSKLKTDLTNIWEATRGQATLKWPKIMEAIVSASVRAKERGGESQRELEANDKNVWQRILDATPIWGKIANTVISAGTRMVTDTKQAWSDLLNFLADVVSRLGFKDLAASIRGSVPAGKGSSYGGSAGGAGGDNPNTKTVEHFARGGIHNADRGGIAGPGRMGLVGEAGQKEAIVNLEKRTPESQMAFREAARSPNARGGRHAPDRGHIPLGAGYRMFASGGVWYPQTSGVNSYVEGHWPVQGSTYPGHGADGDAKNSVDWMTGQGWGVAATGQFLERGNQIVNYLLKQQKSFTDYIIWQRKMYDSGGVSTYRGGGGYPAPTTVSGWHEDHVHWESLENNPGPSVMGGGVSGGITVPDPRQVLYDKLWPRVANMAKGFFSPLTSSSQILSQVAGKISQSAIDRFGTWLDNKIPDTKTIGGSGGSYTGGGSLDKWLAAGLKLGGAFPANASNVAKLHSLAMEESSGDPNAVNDLPGSNDPSGLLQVKPSTFRAYMVPGHGNIFDPEDNTAASTRYQKARYGTLQSHAPYARGGIATGPGIVGEAGDDEAVINLNRRTPESQMAFRAAARSPNALHRFATGGLSFNGPLASRAIGIARSFWGPSGASFGFGPGWTVRFHGGAAGGRTGNGVIGIDPKFAGSSIFDELLGHEIGHAGGLPHAGPPEALMTNPVMRGDRPIASELSAFARNVGVSSAGGSGSGGSGGSGAGWGGGSGAVNRNSIYKSGGGSQSASTYSGSSAARGRALIEGAVAGWGRPFSGHSPAQDIERGARAGEAQVDELKGLRRDINRLMKMQPAEFADKLRGKSGQDLHRHHQANIREKLAAAGVR